MTFDPVVVALHAHRNVQGSNVMDAFLFAQGKCKMSLTYSIWNLTEDYWVNVELRFESDFGC